VILEAAVFTAWFRSDAATAQKWLAQVNRINALPQLVQLRADVCLSCARKEFDAALTRWQEAFGFIEKLPASPAQETLTDDFLEWRDEIEERRLAEVQG
jgi:hypothetical protein